MLVFFGIIARTVKKELPTCRQDGGRAGLYCSRSSKEINVTGKGR